MKVRSMVKSVKAGTGGERDRKVRLVVVRLEGTTQDQE